MKRILIIKTSSLGDLFHALPAVHALKVALKAEVDWVVQDIYADVVRCFTDVSHVIPFPKRALGPKLVIQALLGMSNAYRIKVDKGADVDVDAISPDDFSLFSEKMRAREYDYVIDLQGLLKSAILARLARTRRRIGPSFHREGSKFFYTSVAGERNKDRHAVDECLDVLRHLNLSVPAVPEFPVKFPEIGVGGGTGPRVALVPCSRWETKDWPPEKFIEVGRQLAAAGVQIFLIGSRDDKPVCKEIEAGIGKNVENLCAKTRIADIGGVLAQMDLVITVDTGPMHIAAALGKPVLAVFGATDPKRTGPYGSRNIVITHENLACRPCLSRACKRPQKDIACLRELDARRITAAARKILGL